MTAAAQPPDRPSRTFAVGLLAVVLVVLSIGIGGFWYMTTNSPLSLLSGGDRPIAAATAFVPARSPFALSLLTRPERLIALQQAIASPDQRRPTHREISQLKQSLLENTGLDYDRDIQPWVGSEITFALTDRDLDFDSANGQQPGYLLALEIAPGQQLQARNFLQTLWQQQSLTTGNPPGSQQISGVRILYDLPGSQRLTTETSRSRSQLKGRPPSLIAASALVGNQFVIFANDVRVLQRSIRATQTAANLAQNRAYRQAIAQLPTQRIGLAYFNAAELGKIGSGEPDLAESSLHRGRDRAAFTAVSLGVTRNGLIAHAQLSDQLLDQLPADAAAQSRPEAALKYLPADSVIALASRDLSQLAPTLTAAGLPSHLLPDFLFLEQPAAGGNGTAEKGVVASTPQPTQLSPELWNWATADYSLGQVSVGQSPDWVLAVVRDTEGIASLDRAIVAQGYSAVPVSIGADEAIAWTRFRVRTQRRLAANSLETEILGLHLQQGDYEIFASSPAAMDSALAAPQNPLLKAERFTQAIAPLPTSNQGYLYIDWPAIAPTAERALPILNLIDVAARPFVSHIQTLAAACEGETASIFIKLSQPADKTAPSQATAPSQTNE
ncbi:DUF3352 domain-containing protein [Leptolyngbya sp. BC1307]|uniref:DUF3352 domain-containing protein n=1 Tax=Leptolyngbya sp. BC1307 TaxID=2029589 RepID=UPI00148250C7|nr:DUF3352 domain-containing protein [Leptolyngbya sp. BC1307]